MPFASQLWRSIEQDQWTDGNLRPALPRYSAFVHQLRCPLFFPLDAEGLPCTRLTLFRVPQIDTDNVDIIGEILRKNPDLQELWLVFNLWGDKVAEIMDIVASMTKLKTLTIWRVRVSAGTLGPLLDRLAGLESLHLEECFHDLIPELGDYMQSTNDVAPTLLEDGQPSRQLRSFRISCSLNQPEIIFEVTRGCPQLEQLSVMDWVQLEDFKRDWFIRQLRSHCPRLKQVELRYWGMDGITSRHVAVNDDRNGNVEDPSVSSQIS